MPWLQPLQRCWQWLSYALFTDLAKTHVLQCRSSVMDTTEVIACAPTVRVRAVGGPERFRRLEKRRAVRYPVDREVRCITDSGRSLNGRLRNLSRVGLGLILPQRIEVGDVLLIEIDDPLEVDPRVLSVTVAHARPMPIRGWFLGCALAQELAEGDVRSMVG